MRPTTASGCPRTCFFPSGGSHPTRWSCSFPDRTRFTIVPRARASRVRAFDFILKSGRAVIHPIYKSTYERQDSLKSDYADTTVFYREHVIAWAKDMRRSIDYLETRSGHRLAEGRLFRGQLGRIPGRAHAGGGAPLQGGGPARRGTRVPAGPARGGAHQLPPPHHDPRADARTGSTTITSRSRPPSARCSICWARPRTRSGK